MAYFGLILPGSVLKLLDFDQKLVFSLVCRRCSFVCWWNLLLLSWLHWLLLCIHILIFIVIY